MSPQALASVSDKHTPARVSRMTLDGECLGLVDGARDYGAIAREMMARHPTEFSTYKIALDYVIGLLRRYGYEKNNGEARKT